MGQLYELAIIAAGEVRDADGNLINAEPIETTVRVTEEQAAALAAQIEEQASGSRP